MHLDYSGLMHLRLGRRMALYIYMDEFIYFLKHNVWGMKISIWTLASENIIWNIIKVSSIVNLPWTPWIWQFHWLGGPSLLHWWLLWIVLLSSPSDWWNSSCLWLIIVIYTCRSLAVRYYSPCNLMDITVKSIASTASSSSMFIVHLGHWADLWWWWNFTFKKERKKKMIMIYRSLTWFWQSGFVQPLLFFLRGSSIMGHS